MSVVCRFRVNLVTPMAWGTKVDLTAMYSPEETEDGEVLEEIRSFYDATPNGLFTATIKNEAAEEKFQVGDEFYLELKKIPTEKTLQAIYAAKAAEFRESGAAGAKLDEEQGG